MRTESLVGSGSALSHSILFYLSSGPPKPLRKLNLCRIWQQPSSHQVLTAPDTSQVDSFCIKPYLPFYGREQRPVLIKSCEHSMAGNEFICEIKRVPSSFLLLRSSVLLEKLSVLRSCVLLHQSAQHSWPTPLEKSSWIRREYINNGGHTSTSGADCQKYPLEQTVPLGGVAARICSAVCILALSH